MIVIWHEAVRQYTHEIFCPVLINKSLAVNVVVWPEEDLVLVRTAIEDMVVSAVFVLHGKMNLLQYSLPKASVKLREPSEGLHPPIPWIPEVHIDCPVRDLGNQRWAPLELALSNHRLDFRYELRVEPELQQILIVPALIDKME